MAREGEIKIDTVPATVQYANSAAVSAGEVIFVAGIGALVALEAGDASETITYQSRGLAQFPITSAVTVSQGNACYWDVSENKILKIGTVAGDFYVGTAAANGTAAGGYVKIDLNAPLQADGAISVYGSNGVFKASYTTIDLAVAAAVADDIIDIKAGSYTLTAAVNITKAGLLIKGAGRNATTIVAAAAADYAFKTVLGALGATKSVYFRDFTLDHGDDATQIGIQIANVSATGRINAIIENVDFESDGGNSIQSDHSVTTSSIRLYVTGGTMEGPVNCVVNNTDDRIRFDGSTLRGGLVTGAVDIAMEIALRNCLVKHEGVTGGHASQLLYAMGCFSETDANPNVYAALDTSDLAGSHTESLLFPAS